MIYSGPLVGIDKQIKLGLEFVDVDDIDDYVTGRWNGEVVISR